MVSLSNYDATDPTFVDDLAKSQESVSVVSKWLVSLGYPVVVRPTFVRPSAEDAMDFSDCGDLEIIQRVEVKRRHIAFTSKDDFPYKTVFVDVCHAFDKAHPKPFAYVILNEQMTYAFIVDVKSTKKLWSRVATMDTGKHRERTFYQCPINLDGVLCLAIPSSQV